MISSEASPAAKLSKITATITRVPRIHALPWQTFGSTEIRSIQFTLAKIGFPSSLVKRSVND